MNEAKIKGKWEQLKGRVEERWGQLTGNDLAVIQGRQEQFVGKLQEVYGISKEEAKEQLREFFNKARKSHHTHRPRSKKNSRQLAPDATPPCDES